MRNFLILIICVVFAFAAQAQIKKADGKAEKPVHTLLWKISGKGLKKPSYLFGTFHIICKKDIPVSKNLTASLAGVNSVYMEMDMDDPKTMIGGLKYVYMKDGKKLKDFYTEDEYSRIDKFFKDSVGMPISMFQAMKPITLEALVYPALLACDAPSGVETEIQKLAKKNKKEIYGFETVEFQGSVFDSIPYDVQAKQLLQIADSFWQYKQYFNKMLNFYKRQQLDSIAAFSTDDSFGKEENLDVLLYNRNKNWVNQLKEIFKKQSVFVAVGAGHLPGERGLIGLLRKEGYTVSPVINNK